MPSKPIAYASWEQMPITEFRKRAKHIKDKAATFVAEVDELFPGLVTLTTTQREDAPRLHDGEHEMFGKILDVTEKRPELFTSLADEDFGMVPNKYELQLLRDRLEMYLLFAEISDVLAPLAGEFTDTVLYLAGKFREPIMMAYRIAKAHSKTDAVISSLLAPVIDFMRRAAVKAAATRAARKAAAAANDTPPAPVNTKPPKSNVE